VHLEALAQRDLLDRQVVQVQQEAQALQVHLVQVALQLHRLESSTFQMLSLEHLGQVGNRKISAGFGQEVNI
jgi:hypothetical protein